DCASASFSTREARGPFPALLQFHRRTRREPRAQSFTCREGLPHSRSRSGDGDLKDKRLLRLRLPGHLHWTLRERGSGQSKQQERSHSSSSLYLVDHSSKTQYDEERKSFLNAPANRDEIPADRIREVPFLGKRICGGEHGRSPFAC